MTLENFAFFVSLLLGMAVVYRTSLKTTRMNDVVTDIGAAGKLEIGTAGMGTILVTIPLNNPCGTVVGAVLTFNVAGMNANATAAGNAAEARITDGASNIVTGLTVGTGSENIVVNNTSIGVGQNVEVTAGSITHG